MGLGPGNVDHKWIGMTSGDNLIAGYALESIILGSSAWRRIGEEECKLPESGAGSWNTLPGIVVDALCFT